MVYGKITVLLLSVLWLSASFSKSNARDLPNSEYGVEDVSDSVQGGLELFERWMEKHDKVYANPHEKAKRYAIFLSNLKYVNERNAEMARGTADSPGFTVGLNVFSDLTNEEFKEIYTSKIPQEATKERNVLVEGVEDEVTTFNDIPDSLDWRTRRAVTGVKLQRQCAGWPYSAAGAIEGIHAIMTRQLIDLSGQQLVDCVKRNNGCRGGNVNHAFSWVVENRGMASRGVYPDTSTRGACRPNVQIVASIDNHTIVDRSDSALLAAVARQPISVGVNADARDFQTYRSGIYDGPCSSNPNDINHAMLIVGYGQETSIPFWIVKNSWGTGWGEGGYMRMRRNRRSPNGICAINVMASYPTKNSGQEAWR